MNQNKPKALLDFKTRHLGGGLSSVIPRLATAGDRWKLFNMLSFDASCVWELTGASLRLRWPIWIGTTGRFRPDQGGRFEQDQPTDFAEITIWSALFANKTLPDAA